MNRSPAAFLRTPSAPGFQLDRQHPELAGKLFAALERAKQLAYQDILDDRAGFSVVYLRELLEEQMDRWGDPFTYGITANKATIDAFVQYNYEQGMTRSLLTPEQLFAGSTLDTQQAVWTANPLPD